MKITLTKQTMTWIAEIDGIEGAEGYRGLGRSEMDAIQDLKKLLEEEAGMPSSRIINQGNDFYLETI